MFVPKWIIVFVAVGFLIVAAWLTSFLLGRNPLPFPDGGSRIFTTPSPEAKAAVVALLREHGLRERFQANSAAVQRSIFWDGTIINTSDSVTNQRLRTPAASIGLVSDDPVVSANAAAAFLRQRGFTADVVLDVEPGLPIVFVVSNVLTGTVLNFRKSMIHLPKPTPVED